jgi:hypothetical protein
LVFFLGAKKKKKKKEEGGQGQTKPPTTKRKKPSFPISFKEKEREYNAVPAQTVPGIPTKLEKTRLRQKNKIF